jgi:hypothetical protein
MRESRLAGSQSDKHLLHWWPVCRSNSRKVSGLIPTAVFALATPKSPSVTSLSHCQWTAGILGQPHQIQVPCKDIRFLRLSLEHKLPLTDSATIFRQKLMAWLALWLHLNRTCLLMAVKKFERQSRATPAIPPRAQRAKGSLARAVQTSAEVPVMLCQMHEGGHKLFCGSIP